MKKISLAYALIFILLICVLIAWLLNASRLDDYAENPEIGDIYILEQLEIYAPLRITNVKTDQVIFQQYLFSFGQAVPDRELLLDNEWDFTMDVTYEKTEILRLYDEGTVVEIYRDE